MLVETFVDEGEHAGTSLKATNWIRVGETAGRGRFAATDGKVAVKGIYLYPLVEDWREQLGLVEREPIQPLGCGEGLDREEWAKTSWGERGWGRTFEPAGWCGAHRCKRRRRWGRFLGRHSRTRRW